MIRPRSLRIQEFRGWRDSVQIDLDGLTVVAGENAGGKSSTLLAVEWCFFGSEIEKVTTTGIEERSDWEIRPRGAERLATEVEVVVEAPEGEVSVLRRRSAGAGARAGDDLVVRVAGGAPLVGTAAEAWIRGRLPDLGAFRRGHALHPERARALAVDGKDRSAALAALLGLDEDVALRSRLAAAAKHDLVDEAEKRLSRLEDDLRAAGERPARDRDEAERRLADLRVPRRELGPDLAPRLRRDLVAKADALAERLAIRAPRPDPEDAAAVAAWASGWALVARGTTPALAGLGAKRNALGGIDEGLASLAPAERALTDRRAEHAEAVRAGGDKPARAKALEAAKAATRAALDRRKAGARMASLLSDARTALLDKGPEAPCPVCGTEVPALAERLEEALARQQGEESRRLEAEVVAARQAEEAAERAVEALDRIENAGKAARGACDLARQSLSRHLAEPVPAGADAAAAARTRRELLAKEIEALEALAGERDRALVLHAEGCERLREVETWNRACTRADRGVDPTSCPSWARFDAAVDAAAAHEADIRALASLAKSAQTERSARLLAAANASVGSYCAEILGDEGPSGIAIDARETGTRLDYRLLDGSGRLALPVLNQSAIHALSLALLFAQAEARAREDGFAWVLLDDPTQGLDAERQAGLAKAVARLAASCAVTVACVEGPFLERVRSHVALPRRVLRLAPKNGGAGARIEEVEAR